MSKKKPERFFVVYLVLRCYQGVKRTEVEGGVNYDNDGTWHDVLRFASISPARAKLKLLELQGKLNYRCPFYIEMRRFTAEYFPESLQPVLKADMEFGE